MSLSKVTDSQLQKYYSDISKALICDRKQKTAFLEELKANIGEYLSATDEADMDMVVADFGTPEEIAKSFIENTGITAIKKKLDIKKYILIFLGLVLIIYLIFVAVSLIDVHIEAHGYLEEGILMIDIIKGGDIL